MASGRGHERFNFTVLFIILAGYVLSEFYHTYSSWSIDRSFMASFTAAFVIGTLFITPDLDLAENQVLAKKNWGILGRIWIPYGYVFSHRGLSHAWFLGPLTRLIYLAGLVGLIFITTFIVTDTTGFTLGITINAHFPTPTVLLGGIIGFYVSQWTHLLADGVMPWHGIKRLFRKR